MDKWIKKIYHTYTHTMDYYSALEKKGVLSFATAGINLESLVLNEE